MDLPMWFHFEEADDSRAPCAAGFAKISSTGFATLPAQDFSDFLFPRIFQFSEERFSGFEEKDFVAWDRGWRWWSQRTPGRNILSPTKQKETIKTRQINHPGKAGDLSKSSTLGFIFDFINFSFWFAENSFFLSIFPKCDIPHLVLKFHGNELKQKHLKSWTFNQNIWWMRKEEEMNCFLSIQFSIHSIIMLQRMHWYIDIPLWKHRSTKLPREISWLRYLIGKNIS